MFKKIIVVVSIALWPVNLFFTNSITNFLTFIIPSILLLMSYFAYVKFNRYYLIPVLLISLVQIKLLPFALTFCLIEFFLNKKNKFIKTILLFAALLVFAISFSHYKSQTIFEKDIITEQKIENNIKLYNNIFLARLLQNELRIYLEKLSTNFFDLLDPNGYFFGNYPWPINSLVNSFVRFSFLTAPFFVFGILTFKNKQHKEFIIISSAAGIVSLAFLNNFDGSDFILWLPLSLVLIHGIDYMHIKYKKIFILISSLLIVSSIPEYFRNYFYKK